MSEIKCENVETTGHTNGTDADYAQMLNILFAISNLWKHAANHLVADNPKWDACRDARITVFWNAISVIDSAGIATAFVKVDLREDRFWQKTVTLHLTEDQTHEVAKQYIERGVEAFVKLGLIQLLFSVTESAFRAYLRAFDPNACNGGTAEFQSIYKCLLKSHLSNNPSDTLDFFDLWREIRNVVHNNGVYFKRGSGSDTDIVYKGETYRFRHGQKIDFVNWNMVLKIALDLREIILQVVNDSNLRALPGLIPDLSQ